MKKSFLKFLDSKNIFFYSSLLVIFIYLITRLPYFIYYPVIIMTSDSASYCAVAFDLLNSKFPLFDIRTPGYPVFLFLVWSFSKTIFAVSFVQSILTPIVSIFFLWVISVTYRNLTLFFAVSLTGFISSTYFLILESALQSEGIFVSMLLLNCGLLILALKKKGFLQWIFYSVTAAALILIKPAALFMFSIIFLLVIFFLINKYEIKYYLALLIPGSVIIFSLCLYNYYTLNSFTITPFGEANLSGATILYMEPSQQYKEYVNEAIKETLDSASQKDIESVKSSWDVTDLYSIFYSNYNLQINFIGNIMKLNPSLKYTDIQPLLREVSFDAIKNFPIVYAKFVMTNFIFFFYNIDSFEEYYTQLPLIYRVTLIDKRFIRELNLGKWQQITSDESVKDDLNNFFNQEYSKQNELKYFKIRENGKVELENTFLRKVGKAYEKIHNTIFRSIFWLIPFIMVFVISSYKLVKHKFKNVDVFIPFIFCMIFIAQAVLVSLVEISLSRYSFVVEFAVYFSIPFLIMMLMKPKTSAK